MVLDEHVERLKSLADKDEQLASWWIRSNPHVALIYALHAHLHGWYGCHCELHKLLIASGELEK